jgi:hypothetical protein
MYGDVEIKFPNVLNLYMKWRRVPRSGCYIPGEKYPLFIELLVAWASEAVWTP